MASKNQAEKNQTKDLKCATHLLSEKFKNMSEEKKAIVRDLGFGGLMHILPLRVYHKLLKELANSFKLGKNTLETGYGSFRVRPSTIGAALDLNASGDLLPQKDRLMFKRIFILYIQMAFMLPTTINKISPVHLAPIFKMDIIKEGNWKAHVLNFIIKGITDYNLKKKKAIDGCLFALMIKGEETHPQPWIANWTREQLVERMRAEMDEHMASSSSESETSEREVHSTSEFETEKDSEDPTRKQPTRTAKKTESKKKKKIQEDSDSESKSNDESEKSSIVEKQKTKKKTKRTPQKTQSKKKKVIVEDSSPEQAQSYHEYEIGTEELEEILRESRKKKNNEKSATQGEKEADLRSTEGHYVSSETIPEVNLGTVDPLSQGHTDQSSVNKPAESMLGLVEESANEPAKENMMVVRIETQSQTEALQIVPIQVCLPLSQTTTVPEIEPTPVPEIKPTPAKSPSEKTNEETTKMCILSLLGCISSQLFCNTAALQNHRQTLNKAHPRFHQLHLKSPEDAAALIMMARTASYIPKQDPMPSFSLGLTDSSQEEASTQEGAATQEGQRAKTPETPKLIEQLRELVEKITGSGVKTEGKTPPIHKQSGEESFQKFETPARTNVMSAEMKEKCYIWATRVKTYADGKTNEYDTVCTLNAQDKYIISKIHFASLQADTHIEAEIVSAMCLILNQQNIKRFQEEIYFLCYDRAIYVMKWLEIIQPENVKRGKYEWDNWTQDEVDHYRVEYASPILFHEMN
ncbi:uncharacterized protein DS421_2g33440 [Arachis hypogaea]|nr:uncharacterized protein DS421_2g33440 [Arachis hypogaea]